MHAVWYFPFTNSPRKHTITYHFSDLEEVYSGNCQVHTKCQLQYLHPPQISTSGKCHCVIIHQTTKATEYVGRGTDFPQSRNRGRNRGITYLKWNSRFSAKILLITFKKHTLLSKQTFQRRFENKNGRYLTTLIFVSVTPN